MLARNLASRRQRTLGIVVNDLHNPFFAEMVDGIQATAAANDYQILIGDGQHPRRGEADAIETLLPFRRRRVILAAPVVTDGARERAAKSAAVVTIGRTASSLEIDTAGLAAMHHLSLTTINQPREEFGRIATELILERVDDGRSTTVHCVVAPALVVRRTSGPPVSTSRQHEVAS